AHLLKQKRPRWKTCGNSMPSGSSAMSRCAIVSPPRSNTSPTWQNGRPNCAKTFSVSASAWRSSLFREGFWRRILLPQTRRVGHRCLELVPVIEPHHVAVVSPVLASVFPRVFARKIIIHSQFLSVLADPIRRRCQPTAVHIGARLHHLLSVNE